MKVLFIIPTLSLGGTTISLSSLINSESLDEKSIDVFVITRGKIRNATIESHDIGLNGLTSSFWGKYDSFTLLEKIKYLPIKLLKQIPHFSKWLEDVVLKITLKKIEDRTEYDVIVGYQEGLSTRFASMFSCENKIAWIHCDYVRVFGNDISELRIYDRFNRIICVSRFTLDGFIKKYPSLKEKSQVIHNFYDVDNIIKKSKSTIEDNLFDYSPFTIISLGRVCDVKQFHLIPAIAKKLQTMGLDFKWYILGSADDPNELKRLKHNIEQCHIEDYVIYLGEKPNPYPYLAKSNLLVSVSKSEACPMIFNEAKVLHIPVLSADFGSAYEFIISGQDGFITSIDDMPKCLKSIIQNREELHSINQGNHFEENEMISKQIRELMTA